MRAQDVDKKSNQGDARKEALGNAQHANQAEANRAVASILLARLLVFEALLQKVGPQELTPLKWLWFQVHPEYMVAGNRTGFRQVVSTLWDRFLPNQVSVEDLRREIDTCTARINTFTNSIGKFLCFVDEAQVLLNKDWAISFPSSQVEVIGRPLFSAVVKCLSPHVQGPIMSGTGLRMKESIVTLAASVLREAPIPRSFPVG